MNSSPGADPAADQAVHPQPITFAGPLFFGPSGLKNYEGVGFETDMPDLEAINGTCNTETGVGCTDPAPGMEFYPIFTTRGPEDACSWQIDGALIPGTTNTFGGSSTTEYGPVLPLIYQGGLVGLPAVCRGQRGFSPQP